MVKKIKFALLVVAISQIILLMNMTPAYSYMIHQTDSLFNEPKIKDKNKIINLAVNSLIKFLKIKQMGIVSADEDDEEPWETFNITGSVEAEYSLSNAVWNCCPEMKDGSVCQDIASITPELCAISPLPTKCEYVAECQRGCCFDPVEGLCTTKSTQKKCINDGGEWKDNENCLIQECQKGCCVLGNNVQFITEKRCELLSLQGGFEKDFRDLETEIECLALSASQFEGACVLQGTCTRKTEEECLSIGGVFKKDYLCSNPGLETNCEKQNHIGCAEGKDEIYWFDSCGNRENIYSSDKDASWNNGKFLTKEDSCDEGNGNINSKTCGNCGSFLSSVCSETKAGETHVQDGDFICKDLKCRYKDDWGNNVVRQNGESWCVYDGFIGDGKDTAGSRHWKRMCVNGEIKVEPCADYRGAICAGTEIKEDEKTFSMASCVMNEAMLCVGHNNDINTMAEKCNENTHCMIKNINVDTHFTFDMCVPRYPRGFELRDSSIDDNICSIASQTCTVYYMKDWKGNWYCAENCNCEKKVFTQQMNDLCISLGDCGSYVNYVGDGEDNIKVEGAPIISWEEHKEYSKPVKDQLAEPQDIDKFLSSMIGKSGTYTAEESSLAKGMKFLGTASGALGTVSLGLLQTGWFTTVSAITGEATGLTVMGTQLAAFASAAIGASIGMMAGAYFAQSLGISGDASMVMMLAGGVAGATAGLMFAKVIQAGLWTTGFWIIVVAVLVMIYIWLIGWGKTKEVKVKFTCMPWQAPDGGKNCEKCNEDSLKPCTKYRCESLGQACKLLNTEINTENPACQSIPYENIAPKISPEKILTQGYKFKNEEVKRVEIRADNGECIPEFTPVLFILKTDEYAQCKYSFQKTPPDYKDMEGNYPVEQNAFTINHSFGFSIPSLDSLSVYNVTGDLKEMFGNMNMYVRCQDAWENFNIDEFAVNFCINSGPDLTPAIITNSVPARGSFLKHGAVETNLTIYLNEPAECRHDVIEGKSYDEMANSMQCKTGLTDAELYGWTCKTGLTNLTNENKFYIKCKDKPWVQTAEDITEYGERNINQEDFVYTLYVSETELEITSISPLGKIESGFEPVSVDLEVETSGGMENGKSVCYYEWAGNWVQFLDTFSDSHKQKGLNLMGGDFNIPVKCQDDAGNIDYENAIFSLDIDTAPPKIIRIYKSAGSLKLITDEEAECYYDFEKCNFNIDNATSITIALSTQHTADWITGQTYYIKCKDIWGNINPGCAIIIRPSSS